MVDGKKLISELTVEEYLSLHLGATKKYEYGIKGIAKTFGCSKDKAQKIKSTGDIDDAIFQNGNLIILDVELALELFRKSGKK